MSTRNPGPGRRVGRGALRAALAGFFLIISLHGAHVLAADSNPTVQGDYIGTLGPLHLKLHITAAPGGGLSGTLDSPDQGAAGIACEDFRITGNALSFTVPSVGGSWHGTIASDGATLSGTWSQGRDLPLTFNRDTFVPAKKPSAVDGFWLGTLSPPGGSLRIQLTVKSDVNGNELCILDSLDQNVYGLSCANVTLNGTTFSFDVPVVHGHFAGRLSADGASLDGTWTQNRVLPLNLRREDRPVTPPPPPKVSYQPAMAPVSAAMMQSVLTRDLQQAFASGALAPQTDGGVTIGVIRNGVREIFAFGTAKPDSMYEIGSITKTFTGLLLAQLIEQGKVRLDEPVRELLPPGTVAKPNGPEITLLDLITHHSGLPRMPDNFHPADMANPYADYTLRDLYAYVAQHGVGKPANPPFLYSNLGVALLGQALADRAAAPYATLLAQEITGPLGMHDTVVSLSPQQQRRLIQGHDSQHRPARPWDLGAMMGAGAIRSTASDMLIYLQANLHPGGLAGRLALRGDARTLAAALSLSHQPRAEVNPAMRIALAWLYNPETGEYLHDGATGGYSSFAFFNPKEDYAAVVLLNASISQREDFAGQLGMHISQRFAGKPAIALSD
ncbi:MAG: serine hydrolase domain-containing protein [Steroidobacteraceae bacterium]